MYRMWVLFIYKQSKEKRVFANHRMCPVLCVCVNLVFEA